MQAASQLDQTQTAHRTPFFRRVWAALGALVLLLLMALLLPYLNVNRFQRRITQSISESLGRPVHLDHVTVNLLPVPGFTLERFVVSEDPAFGAEPTIRAESVRATLRVSTLWRRRIEIGTWTPSCCRRRGLAPRPPCNGVPARQPASPTLRQPARAST